MKDDFIPNTDDDFKTWATVFVDGLAANPSGTGILSSDVPPLAAARAAFVAALEDVSAKRAAYTAAVADKNAKRATLESRLRVVVRRIQANPAVQDTTRKTLGVTVRDRVPSSHTPLAPTDLVGRGLDSGANILRWNRAGNRAGTLFVVEAKVGNAASFALVDVVKTTRYTHENQTPGVQIVYRVRARRGQTTSPASNETIVYAS